ncbi:MAG: septum site-determining protein MinC [Anaerolineaceae bacterium]
MSEINSRMVQIKGIKEGLLVTLSDGSWQDLRDSFFLQIQEQASFYQGAKVALDVGDITLKAADLGSLRDKLADLGVSLWAVISTSSTTEKTAQMLGLATRLSTSKPEKSERSRPVKDTNLAGEEAVFVQRTLRSGFSLQTKGHAVVVGDVNPGAEIIAGGSIIIWGKVRGSVHAGAEGNQAVVVCAMELTPTHLKIADEDAPAHIKKGKSHPEMAFIQNGQIVFESWKTKE